MMTSDPRRSHRPLRLGATRALVLSCLGLAACDGAEAPRAPHIWPSSGTGNNMMLTTGPTTGSGRTSFATGPGGAPATTGPATSGAGGAPAGSTSVSGGAGGAATATATATATTATSTASSTGSGMACQYPAGPYGINDGDTVDPSLTWQGIREGSNQPTTIAITDYFDCDGSKGVNALLLDTSATWCGACQQEAMDLPAQASTFQADKVHVLTLMFQDAQSNPATIATAQDWWSTYSLTTTAVAADPNGSFLGQGSVGLPFQVVVNPRTMKIAYSEQGYSGDYSMLEALAQSNH